MKSEFKKPSLKKYRSEVGLLRADGSDADIIMEAMNVRRFFKGVSGDLPWELGVNAQDGRDIVIVRGVLASTPVHEYMKAGLAAKGIEYRRKRAESVVRTGYGVEGRSWKYEEPAHYGKKDEKIPELPELLGELEL